MKHHHDKNLKGTGFVLSNLALKKHDPHYFDVHGYDGPIFAKEEGVHPKELIKEARICENYFKNKYQK